MTICNDEPARVQLADRIALKTRARAKVQKHQQRANQTSRGDYQMAKTNSNPESNSRKIKPIQTFYRGYKFRSRLEARWAVFFETMKYRWQYEVEGYEFDGIRYLPDFVIDDLYIEIKPASFASDKDLRKYAQFVRLKKKNLLLLCGECGDCEQDETSSISKPHPYKGQLFVGTFRGLKNLIDNIYPIEDRVWDLSDFLIEKGYCSEEEQHDGGIESAYRLIEFDRQYYKDKYGRNHPHWEYGITEGYKDYLVFSEPNHSNDTCVRLGPHYYGFGGEYLTAAYSAARSARFEFGEGR